MTFAVRPILPTEQIDVKSAWYSHQHLDWLAWDHVVAQNKSYILQEQDKTLAAIGFLPFDERGNWIHFFHVFATDTPVAYAWNLFWALLPPQRFQQYFLISNDPTLERLASQISFRKFGQILQFQRESSMHLAKAVCLPITIKIAKPDHLCAIESEIETGFPPLWRLNTLNLEKSFSESDEKWIGQQNDKIIAYCFANKDKENASLHINRFAIAPNAQGQGIGTAFLSQCLQTWEQEGIKKFTVNTWSKDSAAIQLYQKFGFQSEESTHTIWVKI